MDSQVDGQSVPPAGWYESPDRSGNLRWWDGEAWTEWSPEPRQTSTDPNSYLGAHLALYEAVKSEIGRAWGVRELPDLATAWCRWADARSEAPTWQRWPLRAEVAFVVWLAGLPLIGPTELGVLYLVIPWFVFVAAFWVGIPTALLYGVWRIANGARDDLSPAEVDAGDRAYANEGSEQSVDAPIRCASEGDVTRNTPPSPSFADDARREAWSETAEGMDDRLGDLRQTLRDRSPALRFDVADFVVRELLPEFVAALAVHRDALIPSTDVLREYRAANAANRRRGYAYELVPDYEPPIRSLPEPQDLEALAKSLAKLPRICDEDSAVAACKYVRTAARLFPDAEHVHMVFLMSHLVIIAQRPPVYYDMEPGVDRQRMKREEVYYAPRRGHFGEHVVVDPVAIARNILRVTFPYMPESGAVRGTLVSRLRTYTHDADLLLAIDQLRPSA